MKVIVHKNDGKGLIKTPLIMIQPSELTSVEELSNSIPLELEPKIIEEDDIKADKDYRSCWVLKNGSIVEDIDLVRETKKNRLRADRYQKLAELDIQFQRALETNSDTTDIVAEKNRLRDITDLVDSAKTLKDIKAIEI